MSSSNSEFYFFLSNRDDFYFSCLIALISNTTLSKSGKCPCLFPNLRRRAFSFSPLSTILAVGPSYTAFIMLRYIPFILTLLIIFYHKWMLNFDMPFLYLSTRSHNPTWSWCIIYVEFGLLVFDAGFLYLCLSEILVCNFLFLCCPYLVLVSG